MTRSQRLAIEVALVLGASLFVGLTLERTGLFSAVALILLLPLIDTSIGLPSLLFLVIPFGGIHVLGPQITLARALTVLALVWQARRFRMLRGTARDPVFILLVVFGVLGAFTAVFGVDVIVGRRTVVQYFAVLGFGLACCLGLRDLFTLERFLKGIVVIGALDAVLTIAQSLYGYSFLPQWFTNLITTQQAIDVYSTWGRASPAGLFPHRAMNAVFLLLPLVTVLASLSRRSSLVNRLACPVLVLLFAGAITSTYSRTGLTLLLLALGLAVMANARLGMSRTVTGLLYVAGGALAVYGVLISSVGLPFLQRLSPDTLVTDFEVGRLSVWRAGMDAFRRAPFWGHGPGSFTSAANIGHEAHNFYLQVLVESGLVGSLLLAAIVVLLGLNYRRLLRATSRDSSPLSVASLAFCWFFVCVLLNGVIGAGFLSGYEILILPMVIPSALLVLSRSGSVNATRLANSQT